MARHLLSLLFVLLLVTPASSAWTPPKPRPFAGLGLLLLRPLDPERPADMARMVLFREPGVGRLGEFATAKLPTLEQVLAPAAGEVALAAMGKKGEWLRVAYDEAGDEGWVERRRPWRFVRWERFLEGRTVQLLPGLRKDLQLARSEPPPNGKTLETVPSRQPLRLLRASGDWALVTLPAGGSVWLRWRDEDGRFTIAVEGTTAP